MSRGCRSIASLGIFELQVTEAIWRLVDPGETVEQTALREVSEETGLGVRITDEANTMQMKVDVVEGKVHPKKTKMDQQIEDVPDDQGGQVSITWAASDFDVPGRGLIAGYRVRRRSQAVIDLNPAPSKSAAALMALTSKPLLAGISKAVPAG